MIIDPLSFWLGVLAALIFIVAIASLLTALMGDEDEQPEDHLQRQIGTLERLLANADEREGEWRRQHEGLRREVVILRRKLKQA